MARRSSMALYPSAACSRGSSKSKTLPGLIVRFQMVDVTCPCLGSAEGEPYEISAGADA